MPPVHMRDITDRERTFRRREQELSQLEREVEVRQRELEVLGREMDLGSQTPVADPQADVPPVTVDRPTPDGGS